MQENQMIADEVLKRDEERRRRRDEGVEEDEEMPQADEGSKVSEAGDAKPRVVAKTRVSAFSSAEAALLIM
jgi:hypothetical protein